MPDKHVWLSLCVCVFSRDVSASRLVEDSTVVSAVDGWI